MVRRKQSGFSADFQDQLTALTKDSNLLLIGTVLARHRLTGVGSKGNWEMYKVELRGADGRSQSAVVNDPASIPPVGEFLALPVFVGNNGYLREAKSLEANTF